MSYIIKNGRLIAKTIREMKSGEAVRFYDLTASEMINVDRDSNLANIQDAVISNAVKWEKVYQSSPIFTAVEVNPGEFLL